MLYMIATMVDDNDKVVGLKILDTKTKQTMEATYDSVLNALINNKAKIENLKVENNELKGVNGSIDRYARILGPASRRYITGASIVRRPAIVILAKTSDGKYVYCGENGRIKCKTRHGILIELNANKLANGKIVDEHIYSIDGAYPIVDNTAILEKIKQYNAKCAMVGEKAMQFRVEANNVVLENAPSSIEKCIIPKFVNVIGESAFSGSTKLREVNVPDSVKIIQRKAFLHCTALEKVSLPESIIRIGDMAFSECKSLISINIPKKITKIDDDTFSYCESLESIELPSGLKQIGDSVFNKCYKLKSVTFPRDMNSIGDYAFESCYKLNNIKLPDKVGIIGASAFENCKELDNIRIPKTHIIKDRTFMGCLDLSEVTIPKGVVEIGELVFSGCTSLNKLSLPNTVNTIDNRAFTNAGGWFVLRVPKGLKSVVANLKCNIEVI